MREHAFIVGTRVRAREYIVRRHPDLDDLCGVVTAVEGPNIAVMWHGLGTPMVHRPSHLIALNSRASTQARAWRGDDATAPTSIDPCDCPTFDEDGQPRHRAFGGNVEKHAEHCVEHPAHPGNGELTDEEAVARHANWLART